MNHLRKEKQRTNLFQLFAREPKLEQEHVLKDDNAAEQLLKVLNPLQRSCVVLKDIEDFSYEEISKILKIKLGTVRSNLNRARKTMKEHYLKRREQR
jgi:RNA polymerase sigma factor (sigma-70 family)